ncbi:anaerobic sulfite reductase subunit B [Lachnospiraceae bacterium PF1-21]|uniref:Anaerobic sulfite reductase subunit AsrB n=1 Tax=Ohessyouella blattaphilus TaxID=2949333 RepID=A0ABT1EEW1_9FIRM|nr:anaerobic sulfite reductase subunit AsrB [Ohessyouella blattaphilus]MCP1109229.1 anaerobic sulfite reductase subunit AsrB [Ohessyouella blattaphilus]MCR8562623.1 anaerobic sulfite reductase subunit AsrB [Ohessyouella blattaphilus]
MNNEYIPFSSEILEVIKHTDIEYTFRLAYKGEVRPGQFFEVSLPKYGEAPISVSGIGEECVDLTIRRVGKVTNEIFEHYVGDKLRLRGPYGNGFDIEQYKGKELVVVAGGTGLSPVRGVVDYFASHPDEVESMTLIAGFKTVKDILFLEDLARWRQSIEIILTVDCGEADAVCQVGLVTEHLPKLKNRNIQNAAAIVVGPPPMMRFTCLGLLELGYLESNIWVSQERKMCCGIGKCGHCKINDVYVCVDGPVFNYTRAKHLID